MGKLALKLKIHVKNVCKKFTMFIFEDGNLCRYFLSIPEKQISCASLWSYLFPSSMPRVTQIPEMMTVTQKGFGVWL